MNNKCPKCNGSGFDYSRTVSSPEGIIQDGGAIVCYECRGSGLAKQWDNDNMTGPYNNSTYGGQTKMAECPHHGWSLFEHSKASNAYFCRRCIAERTATQGISSIIDPEQNKTPCNSCSRDLGCKYYVKDNPLCPMWQEIK